MPLYYFKLAPPLVLVGILVTALLGVFLIARFVFPVEWRRILMQTSDQYYYECKDE